MNNDKQIIKFFTFEKYHNKKGVGSTKIRVHNLLKYWNEASEYKYGEYADVMIFQKVYCTYDFKYPKHFPGIKILDICDPDWTETPDIYIKETMDAMDAIVCPTEQFAKFLRQMTDKPVRVIKDRFDLREFPKPKVHTRHTESLVWFGYSHNAELLKLAMVSVEKRDLHLTIISNEDPQAWRWGNSRSVDNYTFVKYNQDTLYKELQKHDVCLLPSGYRPQDKFKSENKTVIAELCGIPVAKSADELDALITPDARNKHISQQYDKLKQEYNCMRSISEYKELIEEIRGKSRDG